MAQAFSVVGKRLPRADAPEKVKGEAKHVSDIQLPGMLYAAFLRSPHAHARIANIDASRAEALPGVRAVLTYKNVPRAHPVSHLLVKFEFLLNETVRYSGEEVAAVAAETRDIAEDALELIEVDYQVLPAVFDKEEAMKPGAPLVYPELGSNLYSCPRTVDGVLTLEYGDIKEGFAQADLVLEGTYESPLQHNVSPEPRTVVCQWMGDRLTCWASTQVPQAVRADLAKCLGLPLSSVRVIATFPVGGYGSKAPEKTATLAALLARMAGRPVKAAFSRDEDFIGTQRRIDSKLKIRAGLKRDGTITALQTSMVSNYGRDSRYGYRILAIAGSNICTTLYRCSTTRWEGRHVITNIEDHGAMDGFGDPEACLAMERFMDEVAERLDIGPVDFRLRNCMGYGDKSVDITSVIEGPVVWGIVGPDIASFPICIRQAAEKAGWREKWKGWRTPVAVKGPKRRGIGIAIGMHHCASLPQDSATVKMNADGTADVLSSAPDVGQGLKTATAQVVAEVLGQRYENVNVILADTSVTPLGPGVFASRGTSCAINAAYLAALDARRKLFELAAKMLEVSPEELEAREERIRVKGKPEAGITLAEACQAGFQVTGNGVVPFPWFDQETGKRIMPLSVAVTVAEVEVDTETGELVVLALTQACDCGRAINPTLLENQMDLSLLLSNGFIRTEQLVIDQRTGAVLNPNLLDYKVLTCLDIPPIKDMRKVIVEVPTTWGPFGAKGMAETACTSGAPALANAVYNAIGVRLRGDQLTPDRILEALGKLQVP